MDDGRVSQQFPLDATRRIERRSVRDALRTSLAGRARVTLVGPPGAGKSWELTGLAEELRAEGCLVARHYCYLEPGDEAVERRITTDALFGNLLAELLDAEPTLREYKAQVLASTGGELERVIAAAAAAGGAARPVVLIVDGIDHIARVLADAQGLAPDEVDIVEELAALALPSGVSLVVGSQPGPHLDLLAPDSAEVRMPPWEGEEVASLAVRMGLPDALLVAAADSKVVLALLAERADGSPLYATFLVRGLLAELEAEREDPVEWLRAAPATGGDIAVYYDYLYGGGDLSARAVADVLGAVDFSVTEAELCEILPAMLRPYVAAAVAHLRPILVDVAGQGGLRVFHESFRRFIVERYRASGQSLSATLTPVVDWLETQGFFESARAYRYLLPTLRRIGRTDDVLNRVGSTFVSDSVAAGHAEDVVRRNLALTTDVAGREQRWAALARCAELWRALHTCFEEHLDDPLPYWRAHVAVRGASATAERLLLDGRPTVHKHIGLVLCSMIDDAGVAPPWDEYLQLPSAPVRAAPGGERDELWEAEVLTAISHGLARRDGPDKAVAWTASVLAKYAAAGVLGVCRALGARILRTVGPDALEGLRAALPAALEALAVPSHSERVSMTSPEAIDVSAVPKTGDGDTPAAAPFAKEPTDVQAADVASALGLAGAALDLEEAGWAWRIGDVGQARTAADRAAAISGALEALAGLNVHSEALRLGASASKPGNGSPQPEDFSIGLEGQSYSVDAVQVGAWVHAVSVAAFEAPATLDVLAPRLAGEGWYRAWLRFAVNIARAEAALFLAPEAIASAESATGDMVPSETAVREASAAAVAALIALAGEARPFVGRPRATDLTNCSAIIRETLGRALALLGGPDDWRLALDALERTADGTDARLAGSPFGPVPRDALADLLLSKARQVQTVGAPVRHLVIEALERLAPAEGDRQGYYATQAEVSFAVSRALAAAGEAARAEVHWRRATIRLAGYGMRKDPTRALEALERLQPLADAVRRRTDGSGTHHVLNSWLRQLAECHVVAALVLVAEAFGRDGGVLNDVIEEAARDVIRAAAKAGRADPLLLAAADATLRFEVDYNPDAPIEATACADVVERLWAVDPEEARVALVALAARVEGDPHHDLPLAWAVVVATAARLGITPPPRVEGVIGPVSTEIRTAEPPSIAAKSPADEPFVAAATNTSGAEPVEAGPAPRTPMSEAADEPPTEAEPAPTTPLSLIALARRLYRDSPASTASRSGRGARLTAALSDGLESLVAIGRDDEATRVLRVVARELPPFGDEASAPLTAVGERLAASGHTKIASEAFTLAFARARGGGGWNAIGGDEHAPLLARALVLAGDAARATLAAEIAHVLSAGGYVTGMVPAIVRRLAAWGDPLGADAAWEAAYAVVRNRLPDDGEYAGALPPFRVAEVPPWSDDESLVALIIARVHQPELSRKRAALLSFARAVARRPDAVVRPLAAALTRDGAPTSARLLLQVLWESESADTPVSAACTDALSVAAESEWYGDRHLAQRLLARAGTPVAVVEVGAPPLPRRGATDDEAAAFATLDWGDRLEWLAARWPSLPADAAARFAIAYYDDPAAKPRLQQRWRLVRKPSRNISKFPTPILHWRHEIFESSLHEALNGMRPHLQSMGTLPPGFDAALLDSVLPPLRLQLAMEASRVVRPRIAKPTAREVGSTVEPVGALTDDDGFAGWRRLAFIEREDVFDNESRMSDPVAVVRTFAGVVAVPTGTEVDSDPGSLPFRRADARIWCRGGSASSMPAGAVGALGPLVGLQRVDNLLDPELLVLVPPSIVAADCGLRPGPWPGPLCWVDPKGRQALVHRTWRVRAAGSGFGEERPVLGGSDLLVRPDVFEALAGRMAADLHSITVVRRTDA
jgi:hypothetical protein